MQHLGVGEHGGGPLSNPGPIRAWGVAVVGGGDQAVEPEGAEAAELIVGQGLGGIQHERGAGFDRVDDRLGDRELEAARLARCRAGGNDNRLTLAQSVDRLRLMAEELIERQRIGDATRQRTIEWLEPGRAGGETLNVHDAAVFFEPRQQGFKAVSAHHLHPHNSRDGVGHSLVLPVAIEVSRPP